MVIYPRLPNLFRGRSLLGIVRQIPRPRLASEDLQEVIDAIQEVHSTIFYHFAQLPLAAIRWLAETLASASDEQSITTKIYNPRTYPIVVCNRVANRFSITIRQREGLSACLEYTSERALETLAGCRPCRLRFSLRKE